MTFRTYLRLSQPIPALLTAALYTNGAWAFGTLLFGLSSANSRLLSLLLALPLLLGADLASAAHTALHRPFSPLLPDVLDRVQRATLWAALVCDLAITLVVACFFPAVPAAAVFGFAAPLLLLPCLNRRRLVARASLFNITANLGGLQFPLFGILGWLIFMKLAATRLVPAMQAAPWLFFVGGLAAGAWLLRRAFTRESLRERAETPFISPNVAWIVVFNRKVMARQQEEARQHVARRGSDSASGAFATRPGRDWTVRTVGPRTRDWLRVHWHAAYGAMRHGSFLRAQGILFLVLLGYTLLLPALGFMFAMLDHRPFGIAGYLDSLASLDRIDLDHVSSGVQAGAAIMALLLYVGFTFAFTLAGQLRPRLPYPVSRERLAQTAISHAVLQTGFALLIPTAALTVASGLGQALTGKFAPALGVQPLLELDLVFVPLLLLVASAGRLPNLIARFATLVPLAALGCAIAVSRSWWSDYVVSWPGLFSLALSIVAAATLLRWQIRRHFRTCDLIAEAAEARPFLFAATATFTRTPAPAAS